MMVTMVIKCLNYAIVLQMTYKYGSLCFSIAISLDVNVLLPILDLGWNWASRLQELLKFVEIVYHHHLVLAAAVSLVMS